MSLMEGHLNDRATCDALRSIVALDGAIPHGCGHGYMVIGILILMVSFGLGLHDVEFAGKKILGNIEGLHCGLKKQVGYVWAPNWALASLFILPLAIYNLLAARAAAEMILPTLLQNGMLVRRDGGPVDRATLERAWHLTSGRWSILTFACMFATAIFVFTADFLPVVGNWLTSENFRQSNMQGLNISHPDFEFDWSIAAL